MIAVINFYSTYAIFEGFISIVVWRLWESIACSKARQFQYSWVVNYDFGFSLKLKHQLSLFISVSILWPVDQLIHVGNILSPYTLEQHSQLIKSCGTSEDFVVCPRSANRYLPLSIDSGK